MEFETIYQNIKASFEEQTGYPVLDDTDLGIRMKVVAGELAHISQQIADCEKQLFPQTATGIYLEHHGACRDIYKKPAAAAKGTLGFPAPALRPRILRFLLGRSAPPLPSGEPCI